MSPPSEFGARRIHNQQNYSYIATIKYNTLIKNNQGHDFTEKKYKKVVLIREKRKIWHNTKLLPPQAKFSSTNKKKR